MCLQIIFSHEKSFDPDQFVEIKSFGFFYNKKTKVCSLKAIDLCTLQNIPLISCSWDVVYHPKWYPIGQGILYRVWMCVYNDEKQVD